MQLSDTEKDHLHTTLHQRVDLGDDTESTVYNLVYNLVPYEIRDPEGSAAMQRSIASHTGEEVIDFGGVHHSKISKDVYLQFLDTLTHLDALSHKGTLSNGSELRLESAVRRAHETLVVIIHSLTTDLGKQAANLSTHSTTDMAQRIIEIYKRAGSVDIRTEKALEYEERSARNLHKNIFKDMLNNINACATMLDIFDNVLDLIKKKRSMPESERLA